MGDLALLAEAFCYPVPGRLEALKAGWKGVPEGQLKDIFADFIQKIEKLSLGEWEEMCTHTLDLNPSVAPYVGFQIWGESYQRGIFMAQLNREMVALEIDLGGELPDHLIPVLRYLDAMDEPLPELVERLEPAVQRMATVLRQADPGNPYLDLYTAVLKVVQSLLIKQQRLE